MLSIKKPDTQTGIIAALSVTTSHVRNKPQDEIVTEVHVLRPADRKCIGWAPEVHSLGHHSFVGGLCVDTAFPPGERRDSTPQS